MKRNGTTYSSRWNTSPKATDRQKPVGDGKNSVNSSLTLQRRVLAQHEIQSILETIRAKPSVGAVAGRVAGPVRLSLQHAGVPDAVKQTKLARAATNDPVLLGKVNLIKKVVRGMEDKHEIAKDLADRPRSSMGLRNADALAARGVRLPSVDTPPPKTDTTGDRANHECLAAHRPDPTPKGGSGSGRSFVHWCKKG